MRTFIAIELSKDIQDYLAKIQTQLKASGADVKWVEPNNIHLTLKFLGEVSEEKLDEIKEILENTAAVQTQFKISLSKVGAFPSIDSPRVIWVGIDAGDPETKTIAKDLEEGIAKIGIPKEERAFSSHITIGRTKSGLNRIRLTQALHDLENKSKKQNPEFVVTKITLFKSTLTPSGPIYEALKEASLKTN